MVPSVLAFALSGVYAIVDGFFVGNSVGDVGLSTINIAYPVAALIQAIGTGIGMGGAVYFTIAKAEQRDKDAKDFTAGALWLLFLSSAVMTAVFYVLTTPILKGLGASGAILSLGEQYLAIIVLGTCLQVLSTGLVPLIRNNGGAAYAMLTMVLGFITNIVLDYLFVWVFAWSTRGAALATIIGQGVTMVCGLAYLWYKKQLTLHIPAAKIRPVFKRIVKTGIAPFGLVLTPNISLILINRFSASYGGSKAIACYACISYAISIVYLILQGVGDGSQPLMSQYYGEKEHHKLRTVRTLTFAFSLFLSAGSIAALFFFRKQVAVLLGASPAVVQEVSGIFPIFLLAVPFLAVSRVIISSFYATERNTFSYILTYAEPVSMLVFLLVLPRFGGQMMIWWSAAFSQIFSAILAVVLKRYDDKRQAVAIFPKFARPEKKNGY